MFKLFSKLSANAYHSAQLLPYLSFFFLMFFLFLLFFSSFLIVFLHCSLPFSFSSRSSKELFHLDLGFFRWIFRLSEKKLVTTKGGFLCYFSEKLWTQKRKPWIVLNMGQHLISSPLTRRDETMADVSSPSINENDTSFAKCSV